MAAIGVARWVLIIGAGAVLAGCQEGAGRLGSGADRPAAGAQAARSGVDVEAPEVFSAEETGLWDGRPSLGGIWVAHPGVDQPERVLIRNTTNGQSVAGALFRRERENPGPRIQISSDAAEALGILAGQPTMLSVVALRREEVVPPTPTEPVIAEEPAPAEAPATEAEAIAAAALAATAAEPGAAAVAEPQPVPEDASPSSFGRRAARPEPVEDPFAATAAIAAATDEAAPAEAAPVDLANPQPVPEDRPPSSFGGRNRANDSAAAAAAAPVVESEVSVAPLDATAPAETVAAPAAAPAQSPLRQPYLQVASFSEEANARAAAEALLGAGLLAEARPPAEGAEPIWRVLVGPAMTRAERAAALEKVRELGYADAFQVRN